MTFKVSKEQLTKRDALAAELRQKAETLNIAIAEFNKGIEPLVQAVAEAQADCGPRKLCSVNANVGTGWSCIRLSETLRRADSTALEREPVRQLRRLPVTPKTTRMLAVLAPYALQMAG
jgi:hypothetical protein